jgi:hypothetical protein
VREVLDLSVVAIEVHRESTNILDEDRLWLDEVDYLEVGGKKSIPWVVMLAPTGARKTLTRRATNENVDFSRKRAKRINVIINQRSYPDWLFGKPRRPSETMTAPWIEEVGAKRLEGILVMLHSKSSVETGLKQAQRQPATTSENVRERESFRASSSGRTNYTHVHNYGACIEKAPGPANKGVIGNVGSLNSARLVAGAQV